MASRAGNRIVHRFLLSSTFRYKASTTKNQAAPKSRWVVLMALKSVRPVPRHGFDERAVQDFEDRLETVDDAQRCLSVVLPLREHVGSDVVALEA